MRGQSYDDASAMTDDERGMQSILLKKCPLALYTRCRSHVLSLVIVKTYKVQFIRSMIHLIHFFF